MKTLPTLTLDEALRSRCVCAVSDRVAESSETAVDVGFPACGAPVANPDSKGADRHFCPEHAELARFDYKADRRGYGVKMS